MKYLVAILLICASLATAQDTVYVDYATGNDANPGTIGEPFKTIAVGIAAIPTGGLCYLRGGEYPYANDAALTLSGDGTAENYKRLWSYPGERAIIVRTPRDSTAGWYLVYMPPTASYWHLKDLDITGHTADGMWMDGDNSIIENCRFYHNGYSPLLGAKGLRVTSNCDQVQIINCDAFDNYDQAPGQEGQSADGFTISGTNITMRGCRAYENSDDGFDFFYSEYRIVVDSCFSYRNGRGTYGNGMGFKLGGSDVQDGKFSWHLLRNVTVFDNRSNGIEINSNPRGQTLYNVTGYRNGGDNFSMGTGEPDTVYNTIDYETGSGRDFSASSVLITNSWQNGITVSDADFVSVDTTGISAWERNADGSLPEMPNGFLQLVGGSDMVNAGTDVGLPYFAGAPDLGAFEWILASGTTAMPTINATTEGFSIVGGTCNEAAGTTVSLYVNGVSHIANPFIVGADSTWGDALASNFEEGDTLTAQALAAGKDPSDISAAVIVGAIEDSPTPYIHPIWSGGGRWISGTVASTYTATVYYQINGGAPVPCLVTNGQWIAPLGEALAPGDVLTATCIELYHLAPSATATRVVTQAPRLWVKMPRTD